MISKSHLEHDTFFNYKNYRCLKLNLFGLALAVGAYLYDRPFGGARGNTTLGYTLGIIAAAGILYLMWYGIRRKSYAARYTTVKGCLSAHVWLGVSLVIVVPLHAGFSFGLNLHSAAYYLMLITIGSGIWGARNYSELAPRIESHRGGESIRALLEQIDLLSAEIEQQKSGKSAEFSELVSIADPSVRKNIRTASLSLERSEELSECLSRLNTSEQSEAAKVASLCTRKRALIVRMQKNVHTLSYLRLWLYFHVPVSFALSVCVAIHIFSVLLYR